MFTHPPLKSIVTRPSAMAHIVKALAQIRMGDAKQALQLFDLTFRNSNSKRSNLLLLFKVCGPYVSLIQLNTDSTQSIIYFVAQKCDTAISHIQDLISVLTDNQTMYCSIQVFISREIRLWTCTTRLHSTPPPCLLILQTQ